MKRVSLSALALILSVFSTIYVTARSTSGPVLSSIAVAPANATIAGSQTGRQFTATATFSDSSTRVLSGVDGWAITGSLATARNYHTATLLQDGSVLVTGGVNGSTTFASAERYFPATETWTPAGSMSVPRAGHTATALPNGKVLVVGGMNFVNNAQWNTSEIYDPVANSWSAGPVLPNGVRAFHTAVRLASGKVLITAGVFTWPDCVYRNDTLLYDAGTNAWTPTGSLNLRRSSATATLLADGKVLLASGPQNNCPTPNVGLNEAEVYDPAVGTWTVTGNLSASRYANFIATLPNGNVLLAGGISVGGITASADLYNPASGTFSFTGPLASNRATSSGTGDNGATIVLPSGKVMVAGGHTFSAMLASTELFDPVSGTWTPGASMNTARSHNTATLLFDGRVLVAGGNNISGAAMASAELYSPSDGVVWTSSQPGVAAINQFGFASAGMDGTTTISATVGAVIGTATLKVDRTAPNLMLPNEITVTNFGGGGGTNVSFTANAQDGIDGDVPVLCTPPSESFFPIGTTPVSCTASDSAGNTTTGGFNVTVNQPPDNSAPSSNHNAGFPNFNGWYNANVNVSINAFDNGTNPSGVQSITYSLSGAQSGGATVSGNSAAFMITSEGTTNVSYHSTDNAGNIEPDHFFTVKIDKTAPTASLALGSPANVNGWHKVSPNVQISTSDNAGGSSVQTISYTLSGAQNGSFQQFSNFTQFGIFSQGVTMIAYHATDQAGNSGADQFFTVRYDQQQPAIDFINNITVTATSSLGAIVNYPAPVVNDLTSGVDTVTVSKASGTMFPHGPTTVTVTATDMAGNQATRTFNVTVNKALVSINVQPNAATIDEGQSQFFTAQGVFTDGSTALLPTSGQGGGGGGSPQNGATFWNIHFDDSLNMSQCGTGVTFSSQAISGSSVLPTNVDNLWGPTNSVIHATGTVGVAQVSLTLACVNGQGSNGSLVANWTGTRYEGTWSLSGTSGHATVRGWSPKAAAPTARYSIGGAAVNNTIYVMGGNPSQPAPVEAYDIATDSWSTPSFMPLSREGASYAALNGKIYAAGGHVSGGGGTNTMDVYDPATNSWSGAASMSTVRAQFALVAASNGKLYAIGGETGANGAPLTSSVEAYDPISNTWSMQPPMVTARRFHVAGAIGSTIVVAGGNQSGSSTTEIFNVATNTWSSGPTPLFSISGARAVVINNSMFVVGGSENSGSNRVQMFRPANGPNPAGWALPGDMPTGRGQLAVAAAAGSEVLYAIGGLRNGNAVTTVEAFSTPPPTDLQVSSGGGGGGGGGFTLPTVAFSSTDTSVATINSNGQAIGNHTGQTRIVATANGISSETTNTSATLTVVNPDCAQVFLTITPIGQLPFNTVMVHVDGEGDTHEAPFGTTEIETEPGTFVLNFLVPPGYKATPNPLIVVASCSAPVSYEVFIEALDSTPPSLTVSPNVTAEATSSTGAMVSFAAPSATDDGSGVASVSCDRSSPSQFGLGTTTVYCQATDNAGNQATASFTVSVVDTTRPVLTLPSNIATYATSPIGAAVSFVATAADVVDGATAVSCTPASGSTFVIGVTTVQCSSTDAHGNTATGSFTVAVLSAAQIVGELIGEIDNFQQANGLLNNVLNSLNNGNDGTACSQIAAFINQVQAQAGKKLTQSEAAQLIQIANAAKAALGCP